MRDSGTEIALPLPDGRLLAATEQAGALELRLDQQPFERFALTREGERAVLASGRLPDSAFPFWAASYCLFARQPPCREIVWSFPEAPKAAAALGLVQTEAGSWRTTRERFWQLPVPWLPGADRRARLDGGSRPPKPEGLLYRRFDNRLGQWISFRTIDATRDLERFNGWQNNRRVRHFWQEGGTLAEHRDYLGRIAADPHIFSVISCFDDEPFGYFEVYWAKDDRIAPFYPVGEHDRGLHMLVGEERHRGPHKVASWLAALAHYLFLDDPRTETLVAEPRSDNEKMIEYMRLQGFHKEKEFDFPHKRAALMMLSRRRFFSESDLS